MIDTQTQVQISLRFGIHADLTILLLEYAIPLPTPAYHKIITSTSYSSLSIHLILCLMNHDSIHELELKWTEDKCNAGYIKRIFCWNGGGWVQAGR